MNLFYVFQVFVRKTIALLWLSQEKCVMHVSSRMALRLKKGIKVPERALNKSVSRHFIEAHLKEDLSEKLSNLQQGMQVTSISWLANCLKVVFLKRSIFPGPSSQHFCSQISLELLSLN